ncbi:type IV pilus modification protein PilV [Ideonella dechloratans]|uniref:type IV pilus modification protein PilV n=1 Tax=Ideonella dechloratans TaxID=36863 RepID=UPI0035B14DF9
MLKRTGRRGQRGVALIEVLVAILVVSLGMLAMAGLLSTSTRFGKTSEFRSVATLLANDLADRMRANFDPNAKSGQYYVDEPATLALGIPAAVTCADPSKCSPQEQAAVDLAEWQATLFKALPNGTGYVTTRDGNYTLFDVWVIWRETDADSAAVTGVNNATNVAGKDGCPPNFSTEGSPRCMHFRVGL